MRPSKPWANRSAARLKHSTMPLVIQIYSLSQIFRNNISAAAVSLIASATGTATTKVTVLLTPEEIEGGGQEGRLVSSAGHVASL